MKQLIVFFIVGFALNVTAANSSDDESSGSHTTDLTDDEGVPPPDFVFRSSVCSSNEFKVAYQLLYGKIPSTFLGHWGSLGAAKRELTQMLTRFYDKMNNLDDAHDKNGKKIHTEQRIEACQLLLNLIESHDDE